MEDHPIIAFFTGGGLLMALVAYTVKDLLNKINYLKKKTHEQDIRIAIIETKLNN